VLATGIRSGPGVAFSHARAHHDRFRPPTSEEVFVSGYMAYRSFAASLAPAFQLIFVVELLTVAASQAFHASLRGARRADGGRAQGRMDERAHHHHGVPVRVPPLPLGGGSLRARASIGNVLFVYRSAWESTWPVFLMLILLMSISVKGLLDWRLARQTFDRWGSCGSA